MTVKSSEKTEAQQESIEIEYPFTLDETKLIMNLLMEMHINGPMKDMAVLTSKVSIIMTKLQQIFTLLENINGN